MIGRRMCYAAAVTIIVVAAWSTVAATVEPPDKHAAIALPQYVQGYWPRQPELCLADYTDGMPVAEAAAEFDRTTIDMRVDESCANPDGVAVPVLATEDMRCDGVGCHVRNPGSFVDHDGLWVTRGATIWLDATADLTREEWTAVIVHELGHLVGLDHTERLDSVMNQGFADRVERGVVGLTDTDVAVIDDLYSR